LYSSGGGGIVIVGVKNNGIGSQDVKTSKVEETVLLSLSLSYSNNDITIYDSRPSSCSAYTFY